MDGIKRLSVFFAAPGRVETREEFIEGPPPERVLVRTLYSAISSGTEMLLFRAEFPAAISLDEKIGSLNRGFSYPLKYGYCAAGRVAAIGQQVDPSWLGRLVFCFNPHESHFLASPDELICPPADITAEQAVFLPNMETAVNLVMDGRPIIGEHAAVFGQGIVGLFTTALLARFPLSRLATIDRFSLRREASLKLGAHASLDPDEPEFLAQLRQNLEGQADLCFELSGAPPALDAAISITGFDGRVIIGSWYGNKPVQLDLGSSFHRRRVRLVSSQVSTIAPEHRGRWDKPRRFELAWRMIRELQPERFITHRFTITQASQAYALLDEQPEQAIQVVFTYPP